MERDRQRGEFAKVEARPLSPEVSVASATAAMVAIGLPAAALWLAFHGGGTTVGIAAGAGIPIALALLVVGAGGALLDVPPLRWPGWLALAGAAALPAVAALSFAWTASPSFTSRAVAAWTLPAVVFVLSAAAFRAPGSAVVASVAVTAACAVVAVVILVHLLTRSEGLFLYSRLTYPLDYANGAAALIWIGVPAAVGLSTDSRLPRLLRGLGAGVAAALVSTGGLALSRGGTLALGISLVVMLILSPRRVQVFLMSVAIALAFLAAYPLLFGGAEGDTRYRGAGIAVGFVVGAVLGLAVGTVDRLVRAAMRRRRVRLGIAIAAAALATGGIAVAAPGVSRALSDFTKPPTAVPASLEGARARFSSARSNRWEYWRIAFHTWREHPVGGLGAGTFPISWYRARTIPERSNDPHGWPFQLAAEEGLLGLTAFGLFAVGIAYAAVRACRRSSSAASVAGLAATTTYFFAHGAVDWLFSMSSVYVLAMVAAGAVVGSAAPSTRRLAGRAVDGAVALAGIAALVVLVPTWAASTYVSRGENSVRLGPALANFREAHRWNRWGIAPEQAAADLEASSGALRSAAEDLRLLAAREPQRWEVWAQLEDVLVRLHLPAAARAAGDHVRRLNPLAAPRQPN